MLLWLAPSMGRGMLRTRQPRLQIARAALRPFSSLCFFTALKYLPLAEATAINFSTPVLVVVLAVYFLGERMTHSRVTFVVTGAAGMLLIVRPGSAVFQGAALFALGGLPGNGVTNSFGGKFAWGKVSGGNGIVAGTSVGAPAGLPGYLYGGDTAGNLFAFSNKPTIGGQGEPPMQDIIEPDNPAGAPWSNGKIKVIDKALYEQLIRRT